MSLDEETAKNLFNHVLEIWVNPEIEKRKKEGKIPDNYIINKIQVITPPYEVPFARFNDEVQAEVLCKLKPGTLKNKKHGDQIYQKEVEDMLDIKLTDRDDPNYGHLTMIFFRHKWVIRFDFRINKKLAREKMEIGRDFLETAEDSLKKGRLRVFVDNLFSAVELFVTSQLLIFAEKEFLLNQRHRKTSRKYNDYINLGNYKTEFKELFNGLSGLRDRARYQKGGEFKLSKDKAEKIFEIAKELANYTEKRIS